MFLPQSKRSSFTFTQNNRTHENKYSLEAKERKVVGKETKKLCGCAQWIWPQTMTIPHFTEL
jgi:hypothetical protein